MDGMAESDRVTDYAPLILLVACIYGPLLVGKCIRNCRRRLAGEEGVDDDDDDLEELPPEPKDGPAGMQGLPQSKLAAFAIVVVYSLSLVLAVTAPILMQRSIQRELEPSRRAGVLFASAFLVPFEEVWLLCARSSCASEA